MNRDKTTDMEDNHMEKLNAAFAPAPSRPVRVLQFGEGNFLRAFCDWMIDIANEKAGFDGSIVLVKPINIGTLFPAFKDQDYRYTVLLRGLVDGEPVEQSRVITSVSDAVDCYRDYDRYAAYAKCETLRFVISNTTEAGIVLDETDRFDLCPPNTYPGKLTKFLFERAEAFDYAKDKGLVILPVELIDDNGIELHRFVKALAKLGYEDNILVTAEPFGLWVIESGKDLSAELPLPACGLPVVYTDNQKPYKQRKVRILNGAHTSFVLGAYLKGFNIVRDCMNDDGVRGFMEDTIYNEIIPTLDLPEADLRDFAHAVTERFKNPFIDHRLLDISLNSVSKWRARCLPSVKGYFAKFGRPAKNLSSSFRSLVEFYSRGERWNEAHNALEAKRGDETYLVRDDAKVLEWFLANRALPLDELVAKCAANADFWGEDIRAYL